jgi:hypothetical protein
MKNRVQPLVINKVGLAFNAAVIAKKMKNDSGKGVLLTIVIANQVGDAAVTVKLQHADPAQADGGLGVDIPGAVTPALNANGTYALLVYPGVTVAANSAIAQAIGMNFNIVVTSSGTTNQHDVAISAALID